MCRKCTFFFHSCEAIPVLQEGIGLAGHVQITVNGRVCLGLGYEWHVSITLWPSWQEGLIIASPEDQTCVRGIVQASYDLCDLEKLFSLFLPQEIMVR